MRRGPSRVPVPNSLARVILCGTHDNDATSQFVNRLRWHLGLSLVPDGGYMLTPPLISRKLVRRLVCAIWSDRSLLKRSAFYKSRTEFGIASNDWLRSHTDIQISSFRKLRADNLMSIPRSANEAAPDRNNLLTPAETSTRSDAGKTA